MVSLIDVCQVFSIISKFNILKLILLIFLGHASRYAEPEDASVIIDWLSNFPPIYHTSDSFDPTSSNLNACASPIFNIWSSILLMFVIQCSEPLSACVIVTRFFLNFALISHDFSQWKFQFVVLVYAFIVLFSFFRNDEVLSVQFMFPTWLWFPDENDVYWKEITLIVRVHHIMGRHVIQQVAWEMKLNKVKCYSNI